MEIWGQCAKCHRDIWSKSNGLEVISTCFCAPLPCHGDVLVDLVEQDEKRPSAWEGLDNYDPDDESVFTIDALKDAMKKRRRSHD